MINRKVTNRTISHSRILLCIFLITLFIFGCYPGREKQRPDIQPEFPPRNIVGDLSKIEPPLSDYMEKAKESEFVPVILILKRQLTKEEKAKIFSGRKVKDKKEMRGALIRELKRLAQIEQAQLIKFLSALEREKQVMHVRPLWISNVVGVKAPKSIINRLSAIREIKSIHLDIRRPVKGQAAWGVTQIQADDVWSHAPTSYNGNGVTVAILDTGVDYDHGDLIGRMWINTAEDIDGNNQFTAADNDGVDNDGNGYIDDVVGWNFSGAGNNDPDDVGGHGTHVAGTVAGDGTGGTDTGVAPGARIMALRETGIQNLSTEQECWAGMQYALDNGADIINFSSGWNDIWTPDYEIWRNNVTNLMDAGVLFVTIAHNDSSTTGAPNNVRTPGRVPLAVTLGATDNTDTIAGFSNNGPVSWQTVSPFFDYPWPPGLLKPDVSAPGVNIFSTFFPFANLSPSCNDNDGDGYGPCSGTSMAAPHAAGTAALLLEKDPSLSPYEIKFLLEETAVDLGAVDPDNAYGWGRINALSAINYTIDPTLYDLSVTGTNAVWTSTDIWVDNDDDGTADTPVALSNNHLYARIRNIGGQVVSNVEVKFYYADVATIGISGFDPDGDGDPSDGNFTYIGSYNVPTLGPSGSNHEEAIALVNWNIPVPPGTHWCVGIGIVAPNPPNVAEVNTSNNTAFKNFFNIITSDTAFNFNINPIPKAPYEPFAVEFVKNNLPKEARIELVIDKALEKRMIVKTRGLSKIDEPLLKLKTFNEEYFKILENEIKYVRYEIQGDRAVLSQIVSPKGQQIPARIVVRMPEKVKIDKDMLLTINTLNKEGKRVGGLTVKINVK
ncbi:MAG: S8 family serine peptidase [Planctomycetota bacterium]